jgi:hypothetical protein
MFHPVALCPVAPAVVYAIPMISDMMTNLSSNLAPTIHPRYVYATVKVLRSNYRRHRRLKSRAVCDVKVFSYSPPCEKVARKMIRVPLGVCVRLSVAAEEVDAVEQHAWTLL